jgi:hypothetical protein
MTDRPYEFPSMADPATQPLPPRDPDWPLWPEPRPDWPRWPVGQLELTDQVEVALDKEEHPDRYCPVPGCLWRTGGGYCPRHRKGDQ